MSLNMSAAVVRLASEVVLSRYVSRINVPQTPYPRKVYNIHGHIQSEYDETKSLRRIAHKHACLYVFGQNGTAPAGDPSATS